jgi:VIT family
MASTNKISRLFASVFGQLDAGERVGELVFGLIMVLTFTLGAGLKLHGDREATRMLLLAALGCNVAWGIIDSVLFLIDRLSERRRLHRLVKTIEEIHDREKALALVDRELDERIPSIVGPKLRAALDEEVLARVRELRLERNLTAADAKGALAVFAVLFFTALPAVVPFLLVHDAGLALLISNAVLIGLLFHAGWRWGRHTGGRPWRIGAAAALVGVALVLVATALGG